MFLSKHLSRGEDWGKWVEAIVALSVSLFDLSFSALPLRCGLGNLRDLWDDVVVVWCFCQWLVSFFAHIVFVKAGFWGVVGLEKKGQPSHSMEVNDPLRPLPPKRSHAMAASWSTPVISAPPILTLDGDELYRISLSTLPWFRAPSRSVTWSSPYSTPLAPRRSPVAGEFFKSSRRWLIAPFASLAQYVQSVLFLCMTWRENETHHSLEKCYRIRMQDTFRFLIIHANADSVQSLLFSGSWLFMQKEYSVFRLFSTCMLWKTEVPCNMFSVLNLSIAWYYMPMIKKNCIAWFLFRSCYNLWLPKS